MINLLILLATAHAEPNQLERGRTALHGMTGCYIVDYSYTETEGLKPGYERDKRVYDVNKSNTIKEWIFAEDISEKRIRLQHVMFAVDPSGQPIEGTELKHTGEDWEFDAPFAYDFTGPNHWVVKPVASGQWLRRITNLDEGLRYQCASTWTMDTGYAQWSCNGYAPIPGRETRDMGRKDYQALDRATRVVAYTNNWLERQSNTKIIQDESGKTPLAKEIGKNWYVRLPDSECAPAQSFIAPRMNFWSVLREAWDATFTGTEPFVEKAAGPGQPSRYLRMSALEEKFSTRDLGNPAVKAQAMKEILETIEAYRQR